MVFIFLFILFFLLFLEFIEGDILGPMAGNDGWSNAPGPYRPFNAGMNNANNAPPGMRNMPMDGMPVFQPRSQFELQNKFQNANMQPFGAFPQQFPQSQQNSLFCFFFYQRMSSINCFKFFLIIGQIVPQ